MRGWTKERTCWIEFEDCAKGKGVEEDIRVDEFYENNNDKIKNEGSHGSQRRGSTIRQARSALLIITWLPSLGAAVPERLN